MQRILAVLNNVETAHSVLAAAELIATRLGSAHIDVLHVRLTVDPGFMPSEEVMTDKRQRKFDDEVAAHSADLKGIFEAWHREAASSAAAKWREIVGATRAAIAAESEAAILVIAGWAPRHSSEADRDTINAVLFDAWVPLVVVPTLVPQTVGRLPAIAWKSGTNVESAIAAAMPLLLTADQIIILVEREDGSDETPPPAPLPKALQKKGIDVVARNFVAGDRHIGKALLAEARAAGADLLVMGAYSHSRAYELLFGGATREILRDDDLPVFMLH